MCESASSAAPELERGSGLPDPMAVDSETADQMAAAAAAAGAAGAGCGGGYLQKFRLYETRSRFYLIGRDKSRTRWGVLKIDRLEPSDLNIREDPTTYSESECYELLKRIHDGNKSTGGLRFVTKCYGIIGFVKFLGPYYMLLITRRRTIGSICGQDIYAVSKSKMITIPNSAALTNVAYSKDEKRFSVHYTCEKRGTFIVLLLETYTICLQNLLPNCILKCYNFMLENPLLGSDLYAISTCFYI